MTQRLRGDSPRLLVVGGHGFLGRHIVNRALSLDWDVTSLSLRAHRGVFPPGVRDLARDTTDRAAVKKALRGRSFEYVVNCGGYVDHSNFRVGGRQVIDAHFGAVLNLVEILNHDAILAFVNLGSGNEYGTTPAPQLETHREAPTTPYSLGKVAATHFLQMLHQTEGFPSTTLRLFLIYGPGQGNNRLLPQIIRACLDDRSFPVSEGRQLRDFCFVNDAVDAVFAVFATTAARGEVINIGGGVPVSVREATETVQRMVQKGLPLFGEITQRPGESMALYADIKKARALLGWMPQVRLEAGLALTIDWMRNSP